MSTQTLVNIGLNEKVKEFRAASKWLREHRGVNATRTNVTRNKKRHVRQNVDRTLSRAGYGALARALYHENDLLNLAQRAATPEARARQETDLKATRAYIKKVV